jgi:hypothetical protein
MKELWRTLNTVITSGVTWETEMELPVWLYALVGYTDRRIRKYKYQGIDFKANPVFDVDNTELPDLTPIQTEFWDKTDWQTGGLQIAALRSV